MANLVAPPKMYSHPEWVEDKQIRFRQAELERQAAERLTRDADRFEDEADKRTDRTLADVNKKLEQRRNEVKYWDGELGEVGDKLFKETDKLNTSIDRIDKARTAAKEYLHLAKACLDNRKDRYGIDICADNVHFTLNKEIDVYNNVLKLLDKTEEEAKEQLRRNRKAKYRIDKDSLNKKAAVAVDEYCMDSKPHSKDIYSTDLRPGANAEPQITEPEWTDSANDNVNNAESERANSENTRSLIDAILQQVANDETQAVEETNTAFRRRLEELVDTKGKDEEHMNRVLQEIKDTETSMEDLEICLQKKIAYLQLAEHRLSQRTLRPGPELVLDNPHIRLKEEVCEIKRDIENLRQRIIDHQFQLKGLRRRQLSLEEDIQCKSNSIFIDQVICLGIRESLVVKSF